MPCAPSSGSPSGPKTRARLFPKSTLSMEGAMQAIDPALDTAIDHRIRSFLKVLNSGDGKPVEEMTPQEARSVLTGLQSSVKLELPPCHVSQHSITEDGENVDLTIVRPAGEKKTVPAFMFFHGGGWVLGDFPT